MALHYKDNIKNWQVIDKEESDWQRKNCQYTLPKYLLLSNKNILIKKKKTKQKDKKTIANSFSQYFMLDQN